jgi:allantoinase
VLTHHGTRPAAIHIRSGRIVGILAFDDVPSGCPLDDAADAVVMPGVVDTNVCVSAAGPIDGPGFETATRAAAAGGVTSIIDAPFRGSPAPTIVSELEVRHRAAAGRCHVDVGFWGMAVPGNTPQLPALFEAGVFGFACALCRLDATLAPVGAGDLRIAMPTMTRMGATLLAHAELADPIVGVPTHQRPRHRWIERLKQVSRLSRPYAGYLASRPAEWEQQAVSLLIELCRAHRTRTHIVNLSASVALTPLYHARAARLPMTAGTAPSYLYFVADEIPDGATAFECVPPIRERENREFLWAALANGLIQVVASGHRAAPPGIPALHLSLSVTWTEARARGYTLEQVVDWMCGASSRLAGLTRKGNIDVGYDADLVVFDPEAEFTLDVTSREYDPGAPYGGRRLRGVVERTYLRGTQIYSRNDGWASPQGRRLARGAS